MITWYCFYRREFRLEIKQLESLQENQKCNLWDSSNGEFVDAHTKDSTNIRSNNGNPEISISPGQRSASPLSHHRHQSRTEISGWVQRESSINAIALAQQ